MFFSNHTWDLSQTPEISFICFDSCSDHWKA